MAEGLKEEESRGPGDPGPCDFCKKRLATIYLENKGIGMRIAFCYRCWKESGEGGGND